MTEPIYVSDVEYFQKHEWSLEALRALAQSMAPATVVEVQNAWTALGADACARIIEFADRIQREIDACWLGDAAGRAVRTAAAYGTSAESVESQMRGVAEALGPIGDAVARLGSGAIPEDVDLPDALSWWDTNHDDERSRRLDEALRVMNTVYSWGVTGTDGAVPVFEPLERFVARSGTGGNPQESSDGGAVDAAGMPTMTTGAANPDVPAPSVGSLAPGAGTGSGAGGPVEKASTEEEFVVAGPTTDQSVVSTHAAPASTNAASTSPTGSPSAPVAAASGDSARVGGGALGAGSHGGAVGTGSAGLGAGGLAGGVGTSSAGLGGRDLASGAVLGTVPGAAGPAGGAAGVAGARAGAAASRGGGMGAMMGGVGARARGEDDKEHELPGYLVTLGNGNALIGKSAAASPRVIGA
ncbi:hypothetical protein [Rhodococcus sp. HNM0569]|uniref:hypothetical protein n=1 Tax=Rhodococcus sp. HNM0569 TaxID=2716340 RepID=UPI00146AAAF7|nr:hypothetical protein [Rhodococcus sp. HNM0569]NLU84348.1 hypothetical protein [Rhodococcus sp. HNM0569]